ncbi:WD repeat-containing protein on Y chromosome [Stylophora pistillata]|uniref:WD repeat-containing protein on Y chromosome n=1 Tax=Stylophora pistillata TaxID=50429 RepID=A0A2B4SN97_STYPI|nr:WD repeat-containing protein on Y chromosome [Stylophora pistillata]
MLFLVLCTHPSFKERYTALGSSVFRIRKGITSFDYCKEWNVIVTGGLDHYVRLWNPYVTAKATSVLKGHSSAVTHILVNSDKGEIISAAQDKLSVIEGKKDEPSEEHTITSHSKPLCAAIYNDLFDQVVSACHESVVCVWSLETGEKIIQFSNAHGSSEITAMRFDPSKRRLITGGRDGTVRIWNFNNGCCLSKLQAVDNEEKIITVGWNRNVTIYKDCRNEDPTEEEDPRVWPHFHDDDILSAAMYPTGLVATSSYDGLVKVWNIESGSVNCRLHACDYGLERTQSVIPAEVKRLVTHCNTVTETENRLKEEMSRNRSIYSDKKNRRCTSMQSVGRLKNCSVQKDRLENSQRRKSHLPDLSPLRSHESYHDSSVDKVIFLEKRENSFTTATLITSGSNGSVRAWSICGGGLLGYFTAAQGNHDSVLSMSTNGDNSMLITGDTAGFIKLWDISCYCISSGDQKPATPQQRKLSLGNRRYSQKSSKAGGINTKPPPLVISFRAHLQPIVSLDFVDNRQLIITASKDASVRLWTQTGRYIGLFGQRVLWDIELATEGLQRLPPDIQRIASAETLRSLLSSPRPRWRLAMHVMRITAISRRGTQSTLQSSTDNTDWEDECGPSIGQSLKNILGKFYKPKIRHKPLPPLPKLKFNQDQMIVYSCLNFKDLQAVEEPKTPALLCSHNTRKKSSSGLLPRIAKTRGHRSNSDSKHTTYFRAPGKQTRASTFRKPPEILRPSFKK